MINYLRQFGLFVIFVCILATNAFALDISSIGGDTLDDGNVVTINYNGDAGDHDDYNTSAPYLCYRWDDFDGNIDSNDTFTATNTSIIQMNTTGVSRLNSTDHLRIAAVEQNHFGVNAGSKTYSTQEFFSLTWILHEGPGNTWLQGVANNAQHKMIRIGMGGSEGNYPNITWGKWMGYNGNGLPMTIEATPYSESTYNDSSTWDDNQWHMRMGYLKVSSGIGNTDGILRDWVDGVLRRETFSAQTDDDGFNTFNGTWWAAGYTRSNQNDVLVDDTLFCHTLARVEIGDNINRDNCTAIEVWVPNSWNNTSNVITAEVVNGTWADSTNLYVWIVRDNNGTEVYSDEDTGTSGAQGFPIVIGSGGAGDVTDPYVQNVSPVDNTTQYPLASEPIATMDIGDSGDGVILGTITMDMNVSGTFFNVPNGSLTITGTSALYSIEIPQSAVSTGLGRDLTEGDSVQIKPNANDGTNALDDDLTTSFTMYISPASPVYGSGSPSDFNDLSKLLSISGSRWQTEDESGDIIATINTSSYSSLATDRVGEMARYEGATYEEFEHEVDFRINDLQGSNAFGDATPHIFGYVDSNNYYYVMYNFQANESAIYKVVAGVRQAALDTYSGTLIADNNFHTSKLRVFADQILVYMDGGATPVMSANEDVPAGYLGFGSYNDSASFDDNSVTNLAASNPVSGISHFTGPGVSTPYGSGVTTTYD